jgi:formate-dependent nitrite reductase membrane component NrfD
VLWVWILSLPGERSEEFGWTMFALYMVFLVLYMYFVLRIRISKGI